MTIKHIKLIRLIFLEIPIRAFPLNHCMGFDSNDLGVLEYYNRVQRTWKTEFATQNNLRTFEINRLKASLIVQTRHSNHILPRHTYILSQIHLYIDSTHTFQDALRHHNIDL